MCCAMPWLSIRWINAEFISGPLEARYTPPPMRETVGRRLCVICRRCCRWKFKRLCEEAVNLLSSTAPSDNSIRKAITERGYAFLPAYRGHEDSFKALSSLGQIEPTHRELDVQVLTARDRSEAGPNTYSGNYGWNAFPLHTDLSHWCIPPRYLLLRCLAGTQDVATRLFDGRN